MPNSPLPDTPIFRHFAALNAIPRASKQEERVVEFMLGFGESLGLETLRDEVGNVLIRKPASPGFAERPTVALQAHLDMVHQQNEGTGFDFATEGIRMYWEGDFVRAEGTTLGADNGIGAAAIMSVLAAKDLQHGPLEALFTVDEETGMTGAKGLRPNWLRAKWLLNLDTEDDRELTIGCAGGIDVSVRGDYVNQPSLSRSEGLRVRVRGLVGGHSGMDIHRGLGNAIKMLVRILRSGEDQGLRIAELDGGSLRNAIAREASAWIAVRDAEAFRAAVEETRSAIGAEYAQTDPGFVLEIEDADNPSLLMPSVLQSQLLRVLHACPHGIYRMSSAVPGLVQSSNNLARVRLAEGQWEVLCLARSSVDTEKADLAEVIKGLFELVGAEIEVGGDYPGWAPRHESALLSLMQHTYRERFGEDAHVDVVHAGLECGIIAAKYPELEMVSFGPNIFGAHSPDERVQISSVEKFWGYFVDVLARI